MYKCNRLLHQLIPMCISGGYLWSMCSRSSLYTQKQSAGHRINRKSYSLMTVMLLNLAASPNSARLQSPCAQASHISLKRWRKDINKTVLRMNIWTDSHWLRAWLPLWALSDLWCSLDLFYVPCIFDGDKPWSKDSTNDRKYNQGYHKYVESLFIKDILEMWKPTRYSFHNLTFRCSFW